MKIIKLFKKIFFRQKTEIEYVEAALARYRYELAELDDAFDPKADCCVGCMTGGYSSKLENKIERVEKWLEVLKKRKNKNGNQKE